MNRLGNRANTDLNSTDSWITPKNLINDLGKFELDSCESIPQPWKCAAKGYKLYKPGKMSKDCEHVLVSYAPKQFNITQEEKEKGNEN